MSEKYKIPNRLAKVKVYTDDEFLGLKGAANRQERLLAAMVDGRENELSSTDIDYLDLLRQAFKIMSKELSPILRRRKVEKLLGISSRGRTIQVMADVCAVFCDIDEQNRELDKIVFEHRLSSLIKKLEAKAFTSPSLPQLYKLLAKVQGHDRHEDQQIPYDQLQLPIPKYTSDPNAIPDLSAEDITHEEIDG